MTNGYTSILFERGEFRLTVSHVPAQVCPQCGEAVVGEEAAIHLLDKAENTFEQGIMEDTLEY
ncbi:MAG: YgiT-type zinc finger protein [Chloroflexi bacterium]|nr:YgiT-type zinc finger protein [Chloroflexota bacterium]